MITSAGVSSGTPQFSVRHLVVGIVFLSLSLNANPLANWTPSVVGSNLHLGIISMAYGNGTILACEGWGDSGFTHTSRDGVNWSLRYGIFDVLTPYSATFGNGMFVMAGWGASIHTSMDGSNWTWHRVEL